MDKVKEILDGIKDRFSNPLVFSFICAWIVYNWEIVIALFWYDPVQWETQGAKSVYEFVKSKSNWDSNIKNPLIIAVLYTLLMPFIKMLIEALYIWVGKLSENWNIKLSKDGNVSMSKYFSLRDSYEAKTKRLDKIIKSESAFIEKNTELENSLSAKESEYNESLIEINGYKEQIRKINDGSVLNSHWRIFFDISKNSQQIEIISIRYPDCYIQSNNSHRLYGRIHHFHSSVDGNNLFFQITLSKEYNIPMYAQSIITEASPILSFELYKPHNNELRGQINNVINVQFERL